MCKNDRKLKGTRIFLAHHGVCLFIKYARVNIIGLHVGKAKSVTLLMTVAFFYIICSHLMRKKPKNEYIRLQLICKVNVLLCWRFSFRST